MGSCRPRKTRQKAHCWIGVNTDHTLLQFSSLPLTSKSFASKLFWNNLTSLHLRQLHENHTWVGRYNAWVFQKHANVISSFLLFKVSNIFRDSPVTKQGSSIDFLRYQKWSASSIPRVLVMGVTFWCCCTKGHSCYCPLMSREHCFLELQIQAILHLFLEKSIQINHLPYGRFPKRSSFWFICYFNKYYYTSVSTNFKPTGSLTADLQAQPKLEQHVRTSFICTYNWS